MSLTHLSVEGSMSPSQEALLIRKLCNADEATTVSMHACGKDIYISYDGKSESDDFQ
jgi:hypothetical protein